MLTEPVDPPTRFLKTPESGDIEWRVWPGLSDYAEMLAAQEERVAAIRTGDEPEAIWLLEHPPTYTAGTSAKTTDLLDPKRFPVVKAGRGGEYTYHGPGQRVIYALLDLDKRGRDIRCFVHDLEAWIIAALAQVGVTAERREGRVGVWVGGPDGRDEKIAAIGVRVRRWVSLHGAAVNVAPDLSHFSGIVPCGIREHGVTSLAALGRATSLADFDAALFATLDRLLAPNACAPQIVGD
jgi:lipoyl(octanoyl) transferase